VSRALILIDPELVSSRLQKEEQKWATRLAELENLIRTFEDSDQPAYSIWIRTILGPKLQEQKELIERIHERRAFAREKLEPEVVKEHADREQVEQRRRAKIENKRADRKAQKKEQKDSKRRESISGLREQVVAIYRLLVRKLHPDSHDRVTTLLEKQMSTIWQEVQNAYEKENLEQLISISAWLDSQTKEVTPIPTSSFSQQSERIQLLRRSCARTEKRIEQLRESPAWGFSPESDAKTLRKLRQTAAQELDEEIIYMRNLLVELEEFIRGLAREKRRKR
jgi:hypothetical protein